MLLIVLNPTVSEMFSTVSFVENSISKAYGSQACPFADRAQNPVVESGSNAPLPQGKNKTVKSSSDLTANGGADNSKSEPKYVFVGGVFGCIFYKE